MVEQKKENRSFGEVLRLLSSFGAIEVSFASKMIAAVDPNKPIGNVGRYFSRTAFQRTNWRI